MELLIDIGNTAAKIGYFDGKITKVDVFPISDILSNKFNILLDNVSSIYISSVVPDANKIIKKYFESIGIKDIRFVNTSQSVNFALDIDNKDELGTDLFSDIAGGLSLYKAPLLIVDLGTASKILFVDKNSSFKSCAILPGLALAFKSLANNTALIEHYDFATPKPLLECKNTKEVITSSAIYGHAEMINGLIRRYRQEIGYEVKIILTGGYAEKIKQYFDFEFDYVKNLTLIGISEIFKGSK